MPDELPIIARLGDIEAIGPHAQSTQHLSQVRFELVEIIPDPVPCAFLSSVIIVYWLAKDGRNAAQDTANIAAFLLALPGVANVYALTENVAKMGLKAFLEKTKQEIREDARAKGHTEGHAKGRIEGRAEMEAEYQAWLVRRRADGNFRWDDRDPPPGMVS